MRTLTAAASVASNAARDAMTSATAETISASPTSRPILHGDASASGDTVAEGLTDRTTVFRASTTRPSSSSARASSECSIRSRRPWYVGGSPVVSTAKAMSARIPSPPAVRPARTSSLDVVTTRPSTDSWRTKVHDYVTARRSVIADDDGSRNPAIDREGAYVQTDLHPNASAPSDLVRARTVEFTFQGHPVEVHVGHALGPMPVGWERLVQAMSLKPGDLFPM